MPFLDECFSEILAIGETAGNYSVPMLKARWFAMDYQALHEANERLDCHGPASINSCLAVTTQLVSLGRVNRVQANPNAREVYCVAVNHACRAGEFCANLMDRSRSQQ